MRRTEPKDKLNIFREGVVRVIAWFVNIPVSFGGHTRKEPGKS